jgi:methyl-accepting chemotaxis protein
LKNAYGFELAVFIKEESLKAFALGIGPGIFSDQNRVGQYIRYHATNTALIEGLVADRDLNSGGEYIRKALGDLYGVLVVPLRNATGNILGMIVVAQDFSSSRAAQNRALVLQMLMALFAIVLLSGCILIVIRGALLRPLQTLTVNFARLADGDTSAEVSKPERLCQELAALARQYERLRNSQEQP